MMGGAGKEYMKRMCVMIMMTETKGIYELDALDFMTTHCLSHSWKQGIVDSGAKFGNV